MTTVLITGDRGFIAGYLIKKLLFNCKVVGIDNDWKYGPQIKDFDNHPNYTHYTHDAKDVDFLKNVLKIHKVDYFVTNAAIIGGISLFHKLAYDLLAENERLTAAAFDAAIWAYQNFDLKKIIAMSSSMVFENADLFPTAEYDIKRCLPPSSTYGFQKLAVEYFCKGAFQQYKLPYTIVRPFNCAGIGEKRALLDEEVMSGNIKLAFSHVIPDLIQKIYKGQDPLHILGNGTQIRAYTYGGDVADGIYECIFHPSAENEDFNISTKTETSVLQLAKNIWERLNIDKDFNYVCDEPFLYDVRYRIPAVHKAYDMLQFSANTRLDTVLDEVVPWVIKMIKEGKI